MTTNTITITESPQTLSFAEEIFGGLAATAKYLPSKYFYDKTGDAIFQEIMHCEEYYPFGCELEIFRLQTAELAAALLEPGGPFDLIELGPGDCQKSQYLLQHLVRREVEFTYVPIDISENVIDGLRARLPVTIPGLTVWGLNCEYLCGIREATLASGRRKVVLFLGSNLGNMAPAEARRLLRRLRHHLKPGDMVLIGLDLKKCPHVVLAAYNDKAGITKRFNLNLLDRINRELNGNFDTSAFEHFAVYDPASGACKSYLISRTDQQVSLWMDGERRDIWFARNEEIFMEISQKYTIDQVDQLAGQAFFTPVERFYDGRRWFVDALWRAEKRSI
ncbi:MAG TPA: L-histidine N(alpha)-methyltransferase [Puia sp.]|uniref:L-histidine N(alpha)-methyltransferase n=1 Tax=Puia sp. TaxID=2045100 RepID=UPI002D02DFBF|nr:L-histidine N(alpha)-methyltransferase [Puia sp.]HVU94414.1 L-histidine N(alpha)-methyltransferase [Puia sp.]